MNIAYRVRTSITTFVVVVLASFPLMMSAATIPSFSVLGVQSVKTNEASISISYDSAGATYQWENQPKITVSYINQTTGQMSTSISIGQAMGSRTSLFVLRNLSSNTNYTYRAVMAYGGTTYTTNAYSFRTEAAAQPHINTNQGPTGNPEFSVVGIQSLSHNEASIQVAFDSRNAQYEWSTQPKVSIAYTDLSTGTTYTSLAVGESAGSRTTTITIQDLKPNTKYTYKAVMSYAGSRKETPERTFTTKQYTTIGIFGSSTSTPQTSNDIVIGLGGGSSKNESTIAKSIGVDKVTSNLESIIKTGGYGTKKGVSLAITDTHARVVDGDTFEYTIQYHNANNKTLRTARIVVQLPDQYSFVSGNGNTVYTADNNIVTLYLGSIQPYESGVATFKAKAIGGESGGVETKAMLVYTGGSVSAVDRDTFVSGSQGVLGATVFGSGFFPQTFFGWLIIIVILIIIMIVARRYMTPIPLPKIEGSPDKK